MNIILSDVIKKRYQKYTFKKKAPECSPMPHIYCICTPSSFGFGSYGSDVIWRGLIYVIIKPVSIEKLC